MSNTVVGAERIDADIQAVRKRKNTPFYPEETWRSLSRESDIVKSGRSADFLILAIDKEDIQSQLDETRLCPVGWTRVRSYNHGYNYASNSARIEFNVMPYYMIKEKESTSSVQATIVSLLDLVKTLGPAEIPKYVDNNGIDNVELLAVLNTAKNSTSLIEPAGMEYVLSRKSFSDSWVLEYNPERAMRLVRYRSKSRRPRKSRVSQSLYATLSNIFHAFYDVCWIDEIRQLSSYGCGTTRDTVATAESIVRLAKLANKLRLVSEARKSYRSQLKFLRKHMGRVEKYCTTTREYQLMNFKRWALQELSIQQKSAKAQAARAKARRAKAKSERETKAA